MQLKITSPFALALLFTYATSSPVPTPIGWRRIGCQAVFRQEELDPPARSSSRFSRNRLRPPTIALPSFITGRLTGHSESNNDEAKTIDDPLFGSPLERSGNVVYGIPLGHYPTIYRSSDPNINIPEIFFHPVARTDHPDRRKPPPKLRRVRGRLNLSGVSPISSTSSEEELGNDFSVASGSSVTSLEDSEFDHDSLFVETGDNSQLGDGESIGEENSVAGNSEEEFEVEGSNGEEDSGDHTITGSGHAEDGVGEPGIIVPLGALAGS
ncbi:hypothetical protein BJ508DRAFT_153319 [Ascobolus immersus RN42]|uniref:Uncharacterized protein n=1 Tax=Ascobolus immersus RN42 TaxID=1160509 RepID=A0A3N4HZX3_ASCIM|nr:hypothetical protein BJ508DRAFT_153319 [Ascobolus immersus RN42]